MNPQNKISQSQKLMVFVLSMSLYGLATLFTELIPSFQVGIVEFSVEYFLFIPLTLAMLFDPLSAGLGAATGELVFSEIMLGQFGGLGELEKFLTVTIGVYVAGRLVKNPRNRAAVAGASIFGVFTITHTAYFVKFFANKCFCCLGFVFYESATKDFRCGTPDFSV